MSEEDERDLCDDASGQSGQGASRVILFRSLR